MHGSRTFSTEGNPQALHQLVVTVTCCFSEARSLGIPKPQCKARAFAPLHTKLSSPKFTLILAAY